MFEERDCVVKLLDSHGVEHSAKVQAKSVYEAALKGLQKPPTRSSTRRIPGISNFIVG